MLGDFFVVLIVSVVNFFLLVIIYKDFYWNLCFFSINFVINMVVVDFLIGFLLGFLVIVYDGFLFMGRMVRLFERYFLVNIVVVVVSIMVGCCNVVVMVCDWWLVVIVVLNYCIIVIVRWVNLFIVLFWIYVIGFVGFSFYWVILKNVYELLYCYFYVLLLLFVFLLLYWKIFCVLEVYLWRMINLGFGN